MILGVGLDVVETERIARALALHGRRFEERVYTAAELAECAERADRAQALAGRFAAKEALLKALGTGSARGISFQQVEVVRADGGSPAMSLTGPAAVEARRKGVRRVHLSLSHQPGLAAAVVILEG
jgi:holo-[acyl-carrier protein] synthase